MKVFILLTFFALPLSMWAQQVNEKFSMTTRMFMDELKGKTEQSATGPRQAPRRKTDEPQLPETERLIASPDTIGGVAYISCFIHLKDVDDLNEVKALGVKVQETFDGLDFVTAQVPVNQIEPLADVDNVTQIKVAQLMCPSTDEAKRLTNVDDLLTLSSDATLAGINTQFDGTGVVLGIIDTGIDFQHIAFKDKDGNSRIKRAYLYYNKSEHEYEEVTSIAPTTDDASGDHGTHTSSTAGGSSVIVDGSTVTVTDNHTEATYGGMAPGADLYLAGVKGLYSTYLANALKKMVEYADAQGKPLVVSNSWGSHYGPRNGTGEWVKLVGQYFGDSHPNRIILHSSSNNAGRGTVSEPGGYFLNKNSVSSGSPLGTIIRTRSGKGGDTYSSLLANAWADSKLNCNLYVLDNSTGEILKSWTVTSTTSTFEGLNDYYTGTLGVDIGMDFGKYGVVVYVSSTSFNAITNGAYTLAIEVYPVSDTADVDMWAGNDTFFTNFLTTDGHPWTEGNDDMCTNPETTAHDAISVGAYMSKTNWIIYDGSSHGYTVSNTLGDIASFSSYATSDKSPTGQAYPWITAPGAMVTAGVNHYHTGDDSYYGSSNANLLIVNNSLSPYGVMQGTSMSTPVAAGIVALWMQAAQSVGKELTVNEVKEIMEATAIKDRYVLTEANASHFGKGKIDALAGIQYILNNYDGKLDLDNKYNNIKAISTVAGKACDVTLSGRTLYKDGDWNTLCLPFNLNSFSGTPLEGATVKTLEGSEFNNETGELTLTFSTDLTAIEAGKPYLVKWTKASDYDENPSSYDIIDPVFNDVTVSGTVNNATSTYADFVGTYNQTTLAGGDKTSLYLGSGNNLYYPAPGKNRAIGSCRAYFALHLNGRNDVKEFVLNFGNDDADGLKDLKDFRDSKDLNDTWFDLNGRRLAGKPTQRGVYINNSHKVVIQ